MCDLPTGLLTKFASLTQNNRPCLKRNNTNRNLINKHLFWSREAVGPRRLTASKLERGGGYYAKFEHLDETKDLAVDVEHLEKRSSPAGPALSLSNGDA